MKFSLVQLLAAGLFSLRKGAALLLFFAFCLSAKPAGNYSSGSRAASMANAAVTFHDLWSVYHNQAGLAGVSSVSAGIHYENKFNVSEFALRAVALAVPARPGTIGFSYSYFGFPSYNENSFGLAFGRFFGENVAAGIRLNYLQIYIAEEYGDARNLTVEGGFIAELAEGFRVAAHVYNPSREKIGNPSRQVLPTIFRFGVGYMFGGKIFATIEAEKELERKAVFRAGLEAGFFDSFYLRTGILSDPVQNSFGLGYVYRGINADMAFTHHQVLGFTPHISLSYKF